MRTAGSTTVTTTAITTDTTPSRQPLPISLPPPPWSKPEDVSDHTRRTLHRGTGLSTGPGRLLRCFQWGGASALQQYVQGTGLGHQALTAIVAALSTTATTAIAIAIVAIAGFVSSQCQAPTP